MTTIHLSEIAHGRSGDKGNHANVAIIGYNEQGYQWLRDNLTAEKVAEHFASLNPTKVERFEADNLQALNFLLHNVLGGGASGSLRTDTQGKTYALSLLQMEIDPPGDWEKMTRTEVEKSDGQEEQTEQGSEA